MTDETGSPPPVPGTASAKKGLSPLAWIAIIVGGFFVVGIAGCLAFGVFVYRAGQQVVEDATGSDGIGGFIEDLADDPVKTAAETIIRTNPDLELIRTDDDARSITFSDENGREVTWSFEDIAEGRFTVTTPDGDVTFDAPGVTASAAAGAGGGGGVTVSGPDGETRIGASADLGVVPDWVPTYPSSFESQSLLHTTTPEGESGAFSFKTTDSAQMVADYYKDALENADFAITNQMMNQAAGGAAASLMGEQAAAGRSANLTAIESGGETQVTVYYNDQ